jgi:hypothetical protein
MPLVHTRGWFDVRAFTRDASRLWIVYEQECLITGTSIFGEIGRGATSNAGHPAERRRRTGADRDRGDGR